MRLTKQTNYAFRILMYCAINSSKMSQTKEIATAYGVSETFMFKIVQILRKGGLLESTRGRNGGLVLARNASDISLLDVVKVTEDNFLLAECFDEKSSECPLIDVCAVNSALREALTAFFEVLAKYTIQDMVENRLSISQRLNLPEFETA